MHKITATINQISDYLGDLLSVSSFEDSSLNGLQVESHQDIGKIAACVDFSSSIAEKSHQEGAGTIICHHGLIWGKLGPITGALASTLQYLFSNKINLIALHLPLDAHETFGNNAIIAKEILQLSDVTPELKFGTNPTNKKCLGFIGNNSNKTPLKAMTELFCGLPGSLDKPLTLNFGPSTPQNVAVISGAGADALYQFKDSGFDTLITGEPRQFAYHFCKENKLNAIFAGHYATETFGVRKLSQHLAEKYSTSWIFIDEPTGI
ncbi:MAG TPA: Nif3-like dinuclear metal center hexameric protein [Oligoflexia bacterium]|nr:Nif3-like dinuclear metal center hexameric protein [Oligoflexia bacterium]HMP49162.1 Nif3-like dinuclear metal center hexameric protein [Oligoflexia bacterium]